MVDKHYSGSFLQVIEDTVGVDKLTVSRVVRDVCPADEELVKIGFYEITSFSCVIGCISCTHIQIQAPHLDKHFYVNRKRYHSINVQAVCYD